MNRIFSPSQALTQQSRAHNRKTAMQRVPMISIITVTYNAESLVERTMSSVHEQTYSRVEHIIVDGLSTDGTLQLVKSFRLESLHIISERDTGIYDAMNKGLTMATGEYVIFMNAGDTFHNANTLQNIMQLDADADVYYGNTSVVNIQGDVLADRRLTPPKRLDWRSLQYGMCVSHQSILARRVLCPSFDLTYKISADIDWTIRLLKVSKKVINVHGYVSRFLEGGTSAKRRKQGLKERWMIMQRHYGWWIALRNHLYIVLRFVWHRISRRSMT